MTGASRTDLGSVLRLAVLRLSRRLRQEAFGVSEVTPSQLSALTVLSQHGQLTLGELAAIERIAPPSMTRIAARLEATGMLERRPDSTDRRVARVAISPAGLALLRETRARGDAFVSSRLEALTDEERECLARAVPLLERLASEDGYTGAGGGRWVGRGAGSAGGVLCPRSAGSAGGVPCRGLAVRRVPADECYRRRRWDM